MSYQETDARLLRVLAHANQFTVTAITAAVIVLVPSSARAAWPGGCDECEEHKPASKPAGRAGDNLPGSAIADAAPAVAGAARMASTGPKVETITVRADRPTSLPAHIPTTIEGITGKEIAEKINATDAQDALKYFPSLLVRKRNIGDYDHAVLATRASGTGNSARSLVYADGILLSNLLGNGASFTPRWGLVTPEEIERVDVLYGPFSAAYPGNSVGAVVDYITRMPGRFEAHAGYSAFTQKFELYETSKRFSGNQTSGSIGNRHGAFSWWLNANRLENDGQPLTFATKVISTGTTAAGTPVTGAVAGQNPREQDQWIISTGTQTHTVQQNAKIKVAWDFSPTLRASYIFGMWKNDAQRGSETYLRDASGNPFYSGNAVIGGRTFNIAATEISLNRGDLQHRAHGLSIKSNTQGTWDWEGAASVYDYFQDIVRAPTVARPLADSGGAGRITDLDGTGWTTLSLKGVWRPMGKGGRHLIDVGVQQDSQTLRTLVSNTDNWLSGAAQSRFSAFQGETTTTSLFVQDTLRLAEQWRATLGLRAERWEARDGALSDPTRTLTFASRSSNEISPKVAISWQPDESWVFKASLGRAFRYPTVSELYQGSISTNSIVNNDPDLKPEKSWTSEWTAEHEFGPGALRTTLFFETTEDALYSQTNVLVVPNVTNIQNVDEIRTRGLELAWVGSNVFVKGLDLSGSLTFADSNIEKNDRFPASLGKRQPRVPRWRANLLATWRADEKWSATLGMRYSGKQFNTLDNVDPNGFAYTGTSKFFVADVRVRHRFDKQWSASFGIDNLNNYTYWNFHPYPARTFMADVKFDY
jgi:iron complex outermembrane recepter protein